MPNPNRIDSSLSCLVWQFCNDSQLRVRSYFYLFNVMGNRNKTENSWKVSIDCFAYFERSWYKSIYINNYNHTMFDQ